MSSSQFNADNIANLTDLPHEDLLKLEKDIGGEFANLAKSYINGRLVRIHHMIDSLNQSIRLVSLNDRNWLKIYNFEIETINNIKTNTEDLILVNDGLLTNKPDLIQTIDEYEEELIEVFKSLQSPLNFDDSISSQKNSKLALPHLFDSFSKNHQQNLQTIVNEKNYQINLYKNLFDSNSTIVWKQYFHKLKSRKQELIDQTLNELYNLNKQYHGQDQNIKYNRKIQNYYKSLLSPQELIDNDAQINTINSNNLSTITKNNRDPNYANDNTYINKNKIELSDTRKDIINQTNSFESQQNFSNKRIKLSTCSGLSHNQIDHDLYLINENIDEYSEDSDDNDNDNEIDEEEDLKRIELMNQATKAEDELTKNYQKLLGMDRSPSPKSSMVFELPPLEKFPLH